MRARAAVLSVVASTGVLFLGWQVGASALQAQTSTATPRSDPTAHPVALPTSVSSSTAKAPAGTGSSLKDGTYAGDTADTQFGPVQVAVTVAGGRITNVAALQLTDYGGRSVQISNYAAPILRSEVLTAQSASVASVSGATYTTDGYLSSLQSALDKAKP